MDIKEEFCFLDFCSENEGDTKDLIKKVKIETVTSSSDIKPEVEDSTCSEHEEHYVLGFNETIKDSEFESKIHIKEEYCWLKSENSCINDGLKAETHAEFYSTKPPSLYKGVSSYTLDLSSTEDLGNDISFNMNKDGAECESETKCQGQESVFADIFSKERSVCSETADDGKVVRMACSLKQSKLLQQRSTDKQDISKEDCMSILSHTYSESNKCELSKKCFKCSSHLKNCRLVLDDKKVNKRDLSNKRLNQLSLKTHKLIDEAKKPHQCNICDKSFLRLQTLKTHKLIHEGIRPHKCNICNKAFTELSNLKKHKLIHEGIKSYTCNICNKAFTHSSSLIKHKLIHEGIKPHKCDICNKAFTQLSTLKKHELTHEGTKPHKCNLCNKAFTHSSALIRHKLIHEGIKPHKCDVCDKAFTQISNLAKHKLTHEGIKPYKCNICNKAFTQFSDFKTHKLFHEGIKQHRCNICNKAFSRSSYLKKHKVIHNDTIM